MGLRRWGVHSFVYGFWSLGLGVDSRLGGQGSKKAFKSLGPAAACQQV